MAISPAAPLQRVPAEHGRAGECQRGENTEAEISGSAATDHFSAPIKAGVRGCEAINREILVKEEQKSQCFFLLQAADYYFLSFSPPHAQSARFLVLSGALNSSCGCKAGLVRGRDPRLAPADARKVTRSLPINYHIPPQTAAGEGKRSPFGGWGLQGLIHNAVTSQTTLRVFTCQRNIFHIQSIRQTR